MAIEVQDSRKLKGLCCSGRVSCYVVAMLHKSKQSFNRYLLNPYIFLSTAALSVRTLENTLYLASVHYACQSQSFLSQHSKRLTIRTGKKAPCLFALSLMTYLSLPSILFLAPIIILIIGSPASSLASLKMITLGRREIAKLVGDFSLYMAVLGVACTIESGGFTWIYKTWGTE